MDWSENNIQGPLPEYWYSVFVNLRDLNLAHNNLIGPFPAGLRTSDIENFQG